VLGNFCKQCNAERRPASLYHSPGGDQLWPTGSVIDPSHAATLHNTVLASPAVLKYLRKFAQMTNTKATNDFPSRICQGDIFRDVEFIESITEKGSIIEVNKIIFPLVIVMTQDCDLEQDTAFERRLQGTDDKKILSILVVPLYNAAHVFKGEHLADLGLKMEPITENKSPGKYLKNNERPVIIISNFRRQFRSCRRSPTSNIIFPSTSHTSRAIHASQFVCTISELFREDLSQRFAAYLARIGYPT